MAQWNLIPVCEWLDNESAVEEAGRYLNNSPRKMVAFDTETTGLHVIRDYPLMLSLSDGVRRFACMWDPWGWHPAIKGILENPSIIKIGTSIKFDMHMCANRGVYVSGELRDTLVMDWMYDENRWNHDLKATARDHCGIKMKDFREVFPMFPKRKNRPPDTAGEAIMRKLSTPEGFAEAVEYAGLDAFASFKVHDYLEMKLKEELVPGRPNYTYWDLFLDLETDFTRVLWNMERRGFMIATGHLKSQIGPMEAEMEHIRGTIAQFLGRPLNPNSPKQLQEVFFGILNYTPIKYTGGGQSGIKQPSTDEEVLTHFADNGCPISNLILKHRSISKTKGTYIVGPLELVDDGLRLHTRLNQHGTVTSRLSSSEPNLQNLPRPGGDVYKIREAFVASPGKVLLVSDYEQLEMRLMAHFSQDPRMVQAILDGLDLHCYTVSLMYGVSYEEVLAAKKKKGDLTDREKMLLGYRQAAKATGFGLIYGIGPMKLGKDLSAELGRLIDLREAQNLIRMYFDIFQGVESFIKTTHRLCKQNEYVTTILGRKRRLPGINAQGGKDQDDDVNAKGVAAQAKRQSVNSIIQGTAAEIAKVCMIRSENDPDLRTLGVDLLLQIHDELIFELDDDVDVINLASKRIKDIMEDPFPGYKISVPLPTDYHIGYTWAEAK
jgi:DNA polymerase-1